MTTFHFDDNSVFVTADGALVQSGFRMDKAFVLGAFRDGCEPVFVRIPEVVRGPVSPFVSVCDAGGAQLYLSFGSFRPTNTDESVLFQTTCHAGNTEHLVTVCKRGGYFVVIETKDEIFEFPCPYAPEKPTVSAAETKGGHVLKITAKTGEKKLLALLYYSGDYSPLLQLFCDDFSFRGSDLFVTDRLGGCNRCVRERRLTLGQGKYHTAETRFSYLRPHEYPDAIKPFAFLQRLSSGDDDGALELTKLGFSVPAAKETIGSFDCVADFPSLGAHPFVAGVYDKAPYSKVRYFRFSTENDLICGITPCRSPF